MHEVSTKIGGHLMLSDDDEKLRASGRNGRRRFDTASKDVLRRPALSLAFSVSRLALERGSTRTCCGSGSGSAPRPDRCRRHPRRSSRFKGSPDRALLRQDSVATADLPGTCDEVRGSESKGSPAFCSPIKVSVSLPNCVKTPIPGSGVNTAGRMILRPDVWTTYAGRRPAAR